MVQIAIHFALTLVQLVLYPGSRPPPEGSLIFLRTISLGFTQWLPAKDILSPISDLSAASILLLLRISLYVRYSWESHRLC